MIELDLGDPAEKKITDHLESNGQRLNWLARETGIALGHLHNVLKGKGKNKKTLTQKSLDKINEVLKTDFKL